MPQGVIGTIEVQTVDPAANNQITYTAPYDLVVRSFVVVFVTSGAVANRRFVAEADDGTNVYFKSFASNTQPTTITATYWGYEGSRDKLMGTDSYQIDWPTQGLFLRKNDRLIFRIILMDVNDNLGAANLYTEHFV